MNLGSLPVAVAVYARDAHVETWTGSIPELPPVPTAHAAVVAAALDASSSYLLLSVVAWPVMGMLLHGVVVLGIGARLTQPDRLLFGRFRPDAHWYGQLSVVSSPGDWHKLLSASVADDDVAWANRSTNRRT